MAQPSDGFPIEGNRVKFVKSKLHGRLTNEASFIDEDLRTIDLSAVLTNDKMADIVEVQVPSPTNLLILKLCAFDDRAKKDEKERAEAHAFDVYITVMLASRDDYLEGQRFLARHRDNVEIQKVMTIVRDNFYSIDQPGWQHVLGTSSFHPNLNAQQKRDELEQAKNRLLRWFTLSEYNHTSK